MTATEDSMMEKAGMTDAGYDPRRVCAGYNGHECKNRLPEEFKGKRCPKCMIGHRRAYQKARMKDARTALKELKEVEQTPKQITKGNKIKALVDEIMNMESVIEKTKQEIAELLK